MSLALAVLATIAVGSCLQRVSGMGVGLLGGPVLMFLLGPVEGIMVVNVIACVNAAMTTVAVRANIDWQKFGVIAAVMVFGSIPAAVLISLLDTAWLMVVLGGSLLLALALVSFGRQYVPELTGTAPAVGAGVLGGFTNTLAGIAGPVITVYAQAAQWPQAVYAATLQPIFMVGGFISFAVKTTMGTGSVFTVNGWIWPAALSGMVLGIAVGTKLAGIVAHGLARKISLGLAATGATSAIMRGLGGI